MFVSPHTMIGPSQILLMCDRTVSNFRNLSSFEALSEFGWYTVPFFIFTLFQRNVETGEKKNKLSEHLGVQC